MAMKIMYKDDKKYGLLETDKFSISIESRSDGWSIRTRYTDISQIGVVRRNINADIESNFMNAYMTIIRKIPSSEANVFVEV